MSNNKSFVKGAFVLVIANFIVKSIGVIYKIPLGNLISGDGMAYFSAAFDIYLLLLAFSTSGLPVAVSKMVSESLALKRYSEVNKILKVSLITFVGIGLIGSLLMYCGAGFFAEMVGMPLAKISIQCLAPAVFSFSIVAIFRGYFQGMQNMNPTALTQVLEALTKLIIGIGLTKLLLWDGFSSEYLSAGAITGTTVSTFVAMFLLIMIYFSKINKKRVKKFEKLGGTCRSSKEIVSDLIKIVIPITIGSLVINLTGFLDLLLIMNRLTAVGMPVVEAEFAYGSYKGYAYTIYNLPPSIIASINVTLIPVISSAYALKDYEKLQFIINKAMKIISIFVLPCAVGLMILPGPILKLLYTSKVSEVAIATPLLAILGFATIWTTLASLTTVILQATGKINLPIFAMFIGCLVEIISNFILFSFPEIGITGAPISTNLCYITIFSINLYNIKKHTKLNFNIQDIAVGPIVSAFCMGTITFITYKLLNFIPFVSGNFATIIAIIASAVSYFLFIVKLGTITKQDLELIPGGNKLSRFIKKND